MSRTFNADGYEVTAADVLDEEELAEYEAYQAATRVRHRRPHVRYWPNEDTDQAMYEQWVMRDA